MIEKLDVYMDKKEYSIYEKMTVANGLMSEYVEALQDETEEDDDIDDDDIDQIEAGLTKKQKPNIEVLQPEELEQDDDGEYEKNIMPPKVRKNGNNKKGK